MWWLATNRRSMGNSWLSTAWLNGNIQWLDQEGTPWMQQRAVDAIAESLEQEASAAPPDAETSALLLLFIHGYNNSLDAAARRVAALDADLRRQPRPFRGVVVGFSWPSAGDVTGYWGDRSKIPGSVPGLLRVLDGLIRVGMELRPDSRIKLAVMAHSMGNDVLLAAMAAYRAQPLPSWPPRLFDQALLVAADSDWDALLPDQPGFALLESARRVTVYHSVHDSALRVSMSFADNPTRLGYKGPAPLDATAHGAPTSSRARYVGGMTAINCDEWARGPGDNIDGKGGHGAYFREAVLLADMSATLIGGGDRSTVPGRVPQPGSDMARFMIPASWSTGAAGSPVIGDEPGDTRVA